MKTTLRYALAICMGIATSGVLALPAWGQTCINDIQPCTLNHTIGFGCSTIVIGGSSHCCHYTEFQCDTAPYQIFYARHTDGTYCQLQENGTYLCASPP